MKDDSYTCLNLLNYKNAGQVDSTIGIDEMPEKTSLEKFFHSEHEKPKKNLGKFNKVFPRLVLQGGNYVRDP